MTKHRTTVFLETDILQAIRKVAKDDDRPMAYHYDKALRAYGPIAEVLGIKPAKASKREVVEPPRLLKLELEFDDIWITYERKGNKKKSKARYKNINR